MDYREFPPSPETVRWLQCLWRWTDPAPSAHIQIIYPDGRCELIIHVGQPLLAQALDGEWRAQARLLFSGQQRDPIRLRADGPIDCIGLRLHPAASGLLGGDRLPSLRDRIVDLSEIQPDLADSLNLVLATASGESQVDDISAVIGAYVAESPVAVAIDDAINRLDEVQGRVPLAVLASNSGMASRTFQQRFLGQVGLTLQEYRRVIRLQAALARLDERSGNLADMAVDSGFSDQPHATRELVRLTGLTPRRLTAALREDRDHEDTRRLASAFVRGHA